MRYLKAFSFLFIVWLAVSILLEAFVWRDVPITSKFILKQVIIGAVWSAIMMIPQTMLYKKQRKSN